MTFVKKCYFVLLATTFFLSTSIVMAPKSYAFGSMESQIAEIRSTAPNLKPKVLRLALTAYNKAHHIQHLDEKEILTVVDYSMPSDQKRLWVIDVKHNRVIENMLVAHGSGSGLKTPERFSDKTNSHQSSLGLMKTATTYYGGRGYSLKLVGLEPGYNSHVLDRHVVVHGSAYVNDTFVKRLGRIGRSWGCLAVDKHKSKRLIDTIKDGTLVFAYYPDSDYLNHSNYLP